MQYDLIIVGGGLVGAGLAVALKNSNLKIALVDARMPSNSDPRLIALNDSSCHFLKNVGIWPKLSHYAAPIHQVHISNQGHFGTVKLHSADVKLSSLGYVIPAYQIEIELNKILSELPEVMLYRPAKLTLLKQESEKILLTIQTAEKEEHLFASYVIGADGTDSTVRSQLNIPTTHVDYAQCAIVTRTFLQRSHHNIAYERFMQEGAIAMLPLQGNECATIWTTEKTKAMKLMALSDEQFLTALQKEFGYRLGKFQKIRQRYSFPLQKILAEKNFEGRVFLLGNAAHTIHPIAAQGFNLALYEVAVLAEELLGGSLNLNQVNEKIKMQQNTTIGVSHHLSKIFSNKSGLISCLLSLGMIGLDTSSLFKRKFIDRMMGKSGRVPQLLSTNKL